MVTTSGERRLREVLIGLLVALAAAAAAVLVGGVLGPATVDRPAALCTSFGPGPVNNGKTVIAAGLTLQIPEHGIVAGLTAALQETGLRNLANPNVPTTLTMAHDGMAIDHQAVGILQQATRWGPAADLMAPAVAAEKFFTEMRAVDGWETMPPAHVARIVQRSTFPDAYTDDVPAASQFYREHLDEVLAARCPPGSSVTAAHRPLVGANS